MESWKIFFKYFFLLFKKLLCKIMEYGVSRMEFVKTQYVIQMSQHISVLIAFFTRIYFLKVIFLLYILICSVTCFFCSIAFHLLSSSVLLCHPHWCVHFQILHTTMNFCQWKLNLMWSCKWIICKRITEHSCWRVGLLLTHQSFAGVTIACLKSRYLENKTFFFLQIKKFINCALRATLWQK